MEMQNTWTVAAFHKEKSIVIIIIIKSRGVHRHSRQLSDKRRRSVGRCAAIYRVVGVDRSKFIVGLPLNTYAVRFAGNNA
jgi:hypothetical protein